MKKYPLLELEQLLSNRLKARKYYESLDLAYSKNRNFGDVSSPVALKIAKRRKTDAMEVAEEIIKGLRLPSYVEAVSVSKPGFINFKLTDDFYIKILRSSWQLPISGYVKKQKVLVEYSSPNIAKPFGVGHLRSTIIGDAVANLYSALGCKVTRVNHLGDWGTQFGKLMYAYKKWGNEEVVKKDPIAELLRLYVRFHTEAELDSSIENKARYWFKKLENNDEQAQKLWRLFTGWSLAEFHRIYKILGVKFDIEKGESAYIASSPAVVAELKRKGLAGESQGALVVKFSGDKMTPALLVKQDGTTLYMTRDLAALKHRLKDMHSDVVIYHVGSEQALHFKQLFEIAESAGWAKPEQLVYAPHGLVRLADGVMSTRKGKVIELDRVLQESVERARKVVDNKNSSLNKAQKEKVAQAVGIGAIKYNDLQNNRQTAITFDWDKMLSLEGNSAPYLQYAYARLRSVFRKAHTQPRIGRVINEDEREIAWKIAQLPDVMALAAHTHSPNIVASYIYELSGLLSSYYEKYPVIKSETKTKRHRLAVLDAGADIIKIGLELLGIEAPEEV